MQFLPIPKMKRAFHLPRAEVVSADALIGVLTGRSSRQRCPLRHLSAYISCVVRRGPENENLTAEWQSFTNNRKE